MTHRTTLVAVLLVALGSGCTSSDERARTYYESLDLGTPLTAAETFVDAFAEDDFMTVYLTLDREAQFRVHQGMNLFEYGLLVRIDAIEDLEGELRRALAIEDMEHADAWYIFDRVMLMADRNDAFLVDLSGEVALESAGPDEVRATVPGIDGDVTISLTKSTTGRWRVRQVLVPGGNADDIPWAVPG